MERKEIPDVRDEMRIRNRILGLVPENKRKSVDEDLKSLMIMTRHEESFSGPIPHPDMFKKYEDVLSGSADRILKMAEEQQVHRMRLEDAAIRNQLKMNKRGQIFAFVIFILGLGLSVIFAYVGMKTFAGIFATVTIVTIIGMFINGKRAIGKDLANKRQ